MLCNFYKRFSFRYFGLCFVGLYFVLVSDYLVKFREGEYKLPFYSFHSRAKGGSRSMFDHMQCFKMSN